MPVSGLSASKLTSSRRVSSTRLSTCLPQNNPPVFSHGFQNKLYTVTSIMTRIGWRFSDHLLPLFLMFSTPQPRETSPHQAKPTGEASSKPTRVCVRGMMGCFTHRSKSAHKAVSMSEKFYATSTNTVGGNQHRFQTPGAPKTLNTTYKKPHT